MNRTRNLVIERSFDAPVHLIWRMWTDPGHFKAWYGPDGATISVPDSLAVLEQSRALTDLGAALRRARRPSAGREHLRQALDLAVRCGATVLAARARDALLAAGGKPRRSAVAGVEALTASERRVAQLAREGLSNRQIAQALFVSMWTVATHLTNAYRKLGIEGRGELQAIGALSSPTAEPASSTR